MVKAKKLHNDNMSTLTEPLGNVTLHARSGHRTYSISKQFVVNSTEWKDMCPLQKAKYKEKAKKNHHRGHFLSKFKIKLQVIDLFKLHVVF